MSLARQLQPGKTFIFISLLRERGLNSAYAAGCQYGHPVSNT